MKSFPSVYCPISSNARCNGYGPDHPVTTVPRIALSRNRNCFLVPRNPCLSWMTRPKDGSTLQLASSSSSCVRHVLIFRSRHYRCLQTKCRSSRWALLNRARTSHAPHFLPKTTSIPRPFASNASAKSCLVWTFRPFSSS